MLFINFGLGIYESPIRQFCRSTAEHSATATAAGERLGVRKGDICLPARARLPPLAISWQRFPRPYPPGVLLLALPLGIGYAYLGWSFELVNALWLCVLIAVAHLSVWLLYRVIAGLANGVYVTIAVILAYDLLIPWSMAGMYDVVAVAACLASLLQLRHGHAGRSAALMGLAVFLHFRALWYLPVWLTAVARAIIRPEPSRRRQDLLWVSASVAVLSSALVVFFLLWPWLVQFPLENPVHWRLANLSAGHLVLGASILVLAVWMLRRRLWLSLATLASTTLLITGARQSMLWHTLFLIPLLALPAAGRRRNWVDWWIHGLWFVVVFYCAFRWRLAPVWLTVFAERF